MGGGVDYGGNDGGDGAWHAPTEPRIVSLGTGVSKRQTDVPPAWMLDPVPAVFEASVQRIKATLPDQW